MNKHIIQKRERERERKRRGNLYKVEEVLMFFIVLDEYLVMVKSRWELCLHNLNTCIVYSCNPAFP